MFILAVIDSSEQKLEIRKILTSQEMQIDFIDSEDDLAELCRQTEPDVLLMRSQYADVSAKYILKHLSPDAFDSLPEKIIVLAEPGEENFDFLVTPGIQAQWIRPANLIHKLLSDTIDDETETEPDRDAPKRILHITDDRLLQRIVADLIHLQTPYELETASTGEEGMRLHGTFVPHLILTDWDLPDIDGIELCRRIKVDQKDNSVIIALFSSMTDEHLIAAAYKAHAKAYIVKPVKPDLLLHKIVKMLDAV